MASDEIVWQIINQQFCSYKLKTTKDQNFCRNEYNVTGFCNRQSCPLANSRYATVRANPETGVLYLYMKTAERSHMPSKWWERIRLSANYAKVLEQLDERLRHWPPFLIHKCKQRATRLTQVALRARRIAREQERLGETVVPKLAPKVRRREQTRERKAEAAAKVERAIERVLIQRLKSGAYGDRPLNVEEGVWQRVLKGLEREGDGVRDVDLDEGIEEELELEREQEEGMGAVEYVSDVEGESEDDIQDLEDWIGGDSPDEDSEGDESEEDGEAVDDGEVADEGASSEEVSGEEAESSEGGEADEADKDDQQNLKKALQNLKRKRAPIPPQKPKKKRNPKGPKRDIEYEFEREPPVRELAYAA